MHDSLLITNNLFKYLADQVFYFVLISFLISIITSAIFQSIYDLYWRAILQKRYTKMWLSKLVNRKNSISKAVNLDISFQEFNKLLGETEDKDRLNILYSLSYTELCGLISNSFSNAIRLKVNFKEEYNNLFRLLIENNLDNTINRNVEDYDAIQISIIFEKNIDKLQSYLKLKLLRFEYFFSFAFAILIIFSLAVLPNMSNLDQLLTVSPTSLNDKEIISLMNLNFYFVYLSILSSGSISPVVRNILQRFLSFK